MRGRSALRLVGVVKTVDVKLELSDEVSMYVLTSVLSIKPGHATPVSAMVDEAA